MPGKYGVYEIRNLVTGSRYVGSSVDMATLSKGCLAREARKRAAR